MKQGSALRNTPYAAPPRAFFKPQFTAVHNLLWDNELFFTLPFAQTRILLMICRWTSGFQRLWAILPESRACEITHLSRAAFYEAKSALVKKGIIYTGYTRQGCSCYRLVSQIQPLIEEQAGEDPTILWESSPVDPSHLVNAAFTGRKSVCPSTPLDHDKDIKEKLNTHHQAPPKLLPDDDALSEFCIENDLIGNPCTAPTVTYGAVGAVPHEEYIRSPEFHAEMDAIGTELEKGWANSANPKSSASPKAPAKPSLTLLQTDLAGKLEICGVNRRVAEKLVLESAPDVIQKALTALPTRKDVTKPAGWLVEEIRSGGYTVPAAVQADTTRRQVAQARQADNAREEARRNAEEAAGAADRDRLQNLPPDQLAQLIAEALPRLPVFIQDRARENPTGFPPLRAEMVAILRQRCLDSRTKNLTESTAAGSEI